MAESAGAKIRILPAHFSDNMFHNLKYRGLSFSNVEVCRYMIAEYILHCEKLIRINS